METERSNPPMAWLFLAVNVMVVALFLLLSGCLEILPDPGQNPNPGPGDQDDTDDTGDIDLRIEPVVKVTGIDYSDDPMAISYMDVHDQFSEAYTGEDLSVALRDALVERMKVLVSSLGEDEEIFGYCMNEIYEDMTARPNRIPTYAEKCIFKGEDSWAIAFNRCNGWEDGIGHFDLYYLSIGSIETIYVTGCYGCNSTAVLAEYHCR
ncbi:MAG: hypothetical protein ACMUHB_01455 [Thermoplasmatota archaeon]